MPMCWSGRFRHWVKTWLWKAVISKDDRQHRTSCWFDMLTRRRLETSKSTRRIAKHLSISERSVRHITKPSTCHSQHFVVFQLTWSMLQRNRRDRSAANDCCINCQQWHASVCFSLMEMYFTSTCQWTIRTTEFSLLAGNAEFPEVDFWFSKPSSCHTSWFLQALASSANDACTSLRKSKGQCTLLRKPVTAEISGRLSPVVWPTVYFPTIWSDCTFSKSDSAAASSSLTRLHWQRLLAIK